MRTPEHRSTYGTSFQTLIDYLPGPARFWGHSAEDAETAGYLERDA